MSNIAIIGAGYVGLVTGLGFAQLGHHIHFVDLDKNKVSRLKNGEIPFFEPNLDQVISDKEINSRITFSSDYSKELSKVDIVFICVQTPEGEREESNLEFLYKLNIRLNWDFMTTAKLMSWPKLNHPTVILHGIADDVVPIENSQRVATDQSNVIQLMEIEDGHRMQKSTEYFEEAARYCLDSLRI